MIPYSTSLPNELQARPIWFTKNFHHILGGIGWIDHKYTPKSPQLILILTKYWIPTNLSKGPIPSYFLVSHIPVMVLLPNYNEFHYAFGPLAVTWQPMYFTHSPNGYTLYHCCKIWHTVYDDKLLMFSPIFLNEDREMQITNPDLIILNHQFSGYGSV